MAEYVFTPPTVTVWYPMDGALKFPLQHGVSVLVTGTTVTQKRFPSGREIANADAAYIGGYPVVVSQAMADILSDAGLSAYIIDYVPSTPGPGEEPLVAAGYDAAVGYDDLTITYDGRDPNAPPSGYDTGTYDGGTYG